MNLKKEELKMKEKLIELRSKKFSDYRYNVRKESTTVIGEFIKNNSPVQVGDIVMIAEYKNEGKLAKIAKIELLIQGRHEPYEELLSFVYWGALLKKDGVTVMKNRNLMLICCFVKDGVKYFTPSYSRLKVIPAKMYEACELYGSYNLEWCR